MAKAKATAPAAAKPKAKAKSSGSKFDFKAFLLQHGERVGLFTALGLTLLLVVFSLFWPGSGLLSPSATAMADDINKPAEWIEGQLRDPNNKPSEADMPAADAGEKRVDLVTKPIDGKNFRVAALIPPKDADLTGRRQPRVLSVEEAKVALARVQVRAYMFQVDQRGNTNVYVLEGEGGTDKSMTKGSGQAYPSGMSGESLKNRMGYGKGGPGAGGVAAGILGKKDRKKEKDLFSIPPDLKDSRTGRKLKAVDINKVDKSTPLATRVQPVRMAIIAAAFPYKKQVEEFRTRLGAKTNEEVLTEASMERDKSKNLQFAFRFLGVAVERRELESDGNPVDGADGQWKKLDLDGDYRPYVVATGRSFEPDDQSLSAISFSGLVMKRLPQFRSVAEGDLGEMTPMPGGPGSAKGSLGPRPTAPTPPMPMPGMGDKKDDKDAKKDQAAPENQYPEIEKELTKIKKTLEDLKEKDAEDLAPPSSRFGSAGDFEAFGEASPPPAGGKDSTSTIMPMPVMPGGPGSKQNYDPDNPPKERELPDHCLVRVVDVTVQPGRTYEYRLKVRMANPNYNRRDTASPAYMVNRELESGEWSKERLVLRVDPELNYYAVNQEEVEKAENPSSKVKYSDRYSRDTNLKPDRMMFFQAHRWAEVIRRAGDRSGDQALPIGEWVVAERFPVYRGEYVGRSERVELPRWQPSLEDFTIATDSTTSKTEPGISVNFGSNRGDDKEAILVDFDQGRITYNKVTAGKGDKVTTKPITDASAGEAILLSPDGKLLVRDTAQDAADEERKNRLKSVKARVREVKERAKGGGDDKKDKGKGPVFGGP